MRRRPPGNLKFGVPSVVATRYAVVVGKQLVAMGVDDAPNRTVHRRHPVLLLPGLCSAAKIGDPAR